MKKFHFIFLKKKSKEVLQTKSMSDFEAIFRLPGFFSTTDCDKFSVKSCMYISFRALQKAGFFYFDSHQSLIQAKKSIVALVPVLTTFVKIAF